VGHIDYCHVFIGSCMRGQILYSLKFKIISSYVWSFIQDVSTLLINLKFEIKK